MRVSAHISVIWVAAMGTANETFPGRDIGVLVVSQQRSARSYQVRCPVLRLAVRTHDPVIAAYPEIVFGRYTARILQRLFTG